MIGRIYTAGRPGFNSTLVTVEADILSGIPSLTIVGLPDHAVRESRERIRSAIVNAGFVFPARQIIINLSPNDTPKEGGLMEAAMAAAVLVATGQLPQEKFRDTALLGSLSLDGSLHTARGIAAAAVFATQQPQVKGLIIPQTSASEVATADSKPLYAIRHLNDLTAFAYGQIDARQGHGYEADEEFPEIGFEHIFGLAPAKRALAIAAVGRHHMLMVGSPGTGKSLLARAYRYLLSPLSFNEAAEVTRIYSLAGLSSATRRCRACANRWKTRRSRLRGRAATSPTLRISSSLPRRTRAAAGIYSRRHGRAVAERTALRNSRNSLVLSWTALRLNSILTS